MGLEELLESSRQECLALVRSLEAERAARDQAERLSRIKDEFLSTLSHELRTPLSAIMGWSQILSSPNVSAEDMKEGLAVIERNARTQSQLIDDLQDVRGMISGRIRLDFQRVELAEVINAALEAVRLSAEAKSLRIISEIESGAGAILGDATRLRQIVWNLLSNAVKFAPSGGWVRVALKRVESQMELSVTDNGPGMSADLLPGVFDRFRQVDTSNRRRTGGLGIGLPLVKHLVDLHGGTVTVESGGENQGAKFMVMLPMAQVREDERKERNPGGAVGSPRRAVELPLLSGAMVLVVDDEPDAREMLRRLLERCQAKVLLASGAREAVEMLQRQRPQVIVSDIGMPGLDGYDMIRLIRALPPASGGQTPAIALTAFTRVEDRRRAIGAGFQQHMKKPVETGELVASVARLLGRGEDPHRGEC